MRERLTEVLGPVEFALQQEWHFRYDKQLAIGHGHMSDPANRFKRWKDPIFVDDKRVPRLEMCPGTLFMVKFVNVLEKEYPFIDNIKPVTALMPVLWKERRGRFWLVAWLFSQFVKQHPLTFLGTEQEYVPKFFKQFSRSMVLKKKWAADVTKLYRQVYNSKTTIEQVRKQLSSEAGLFDFLYQVVAKVPREKWMTIFDGLELPSASLAIKDSKPAFASRRKAKTLSLAWSNIKKEKQALQREAKRQFLKGRKVVVMGHTHQPDTVRGKGTVYFYPGSWTRYADLDSVNDLHLDQLKNELAYPYQLNYVRVERRSQGSLRAEMICFEEEPGCMSS